MARKKENYEEIEQEAETRAKIREKKKKLKMAVSGKSVFKLRQVIGGKAKRGWPR